MKKIMALLLAVMMMATCLLVAACGGTCKDGHVDANHDGICDECGTENLEVVHDWKYTSGTRTTCTEAGTETYTCTVCGATDVRISSAAYGHDWEQEEVVDTTYNEFKGYAYKCNRCGIYYTPEEDDYIRFSYNPEVQDFSRLESDRIYEDVFVCTYTEEKEAEIEAHYADVLGKLEAAERYDEEKHKNVPTIDENGKEVYDHNSEYYIANKEGFEKEFFDPYVDYLDYVTEQYQYTYVFYCVYDDDEWEAKYEAISDYRTEMVKDYYALFRLIYETQYREFFFSFEEGWTEEDIQIALTMSDTYGKEEYAELNKRSKEIEIEFRDIDSPDKDDAVLDLYEEFVSINNQIATLAGYENYAEYAYENVYEREYSPEDVEVMRNFCKQYLAPVFKSILTKYRSNHNTQYDGAELNYKNALSTDSVFESPLTADIISDYLSELSTNAYDKEISFLGEANKLFKNGNYYTGKYKGAFSYYISAQNATILYFGPKNYSGAFTFLHEFGHYYQNIYNPGLSLNMDHDETQSQGNEMLFLSWLENYLSDKLDGNHQDVYNTIKYDSIFDMLAIALLATAVDEFEQAVYAGTWGDSAQYREIAKHEYDGLFEEIMKEYGISGALNSSYWRYVVIEAPCYYISYAMSAIPSMGIFCKANEEGFEAARESYFKLFTFSDEESLCKVYDEVNEHGIVNKEVTATYSEILNFCGLYGPFQEELYIELSENIK